MAYEIGAVVEGKVTEITRFGAFVALPDGKSGMVHISEIANTFVKEIRDYLTENQTVKVKVVSINQDGKIGLSIKRVNNGRGARRTSKIPSSGPEQFKWDNKRRSSESLSFEDKLNKFKQDSNERMLSSKQYADPKRRGGNRKAAQTNFK